MANNLVTTKVAKHKIKLLEKWKTKDGREKGKCKKKSTNFVLTDKLYFVMDGVVIISPLHIA